MLDLYSKKRGQRVPFLWRICGLLLGLFLILLTGCTASESVVEESPKRVFASPEVVGFVQGSDTTFVTASDFYTLESVYLSELLSAEYQIAVFLAGGEIHYVDDFANAFVKPGGNGLDVVFEDGTTLKNIAGVVADPPSISVTQAYFDVLRFLQDGHRVMVVVLDAWGWAMFNGFADYQPFLAAQNVQKAHTVFPPFTPVALASVLTGLLPHEHGVHDRATRTMSVPDMFDAASELGLSSIRVQGSVEMVRASINSVLVPGADTAKETDTNVFNAAMSRIDDADLMFVHFNIIDYMAHNYGPYSTYVREAFALVDGFVQELVLARPGVVIVTADHGQHYLGHPGRKGDHLWVSHEDIFVPYVVIWSETEMRE